MAKHAVVEQPTAAPTSKITAAGVGAGLATLVLFLADYGDVLHLPTFWNSFLTGAAAFAAGYMKKARVDERGE